jgi:hypothetical protein
MVTITLEGTVEPFCCWLRPSPPNLEISLHRTYSRILAAVRMQQWFPPSCHYCKYRPKHLDDYERHIVKEHPRKMAYPGPTPLNVATALYIVESIEKELKDRKVKNSNRNSSRKTVAKAVSQAITSHHGDNEGFRTSRLEKRYCS